MRVRQTNDNASVHAIAGTYVVLLGMNVDAGHTEKLAGWAIYRIDHTENEENWLPNFKRFRDHEKDSRTLVNPVQEFVWGDYTAKPNHRYTYQITPMYGAPGSLKKGPQVNVTVTTENNQADIHWVYFNRGVAASQAYATKFHNLPPDKVPGGAAFRWLSRGLEEALLAFLQEAANQTYALRAAVYEFNYEPVLEAFRSAAKRGVDVKIVVDERKNSQNTPRKGNLAAIQTNGIGDLVVPRTKNPSYIAHNKFIVLLKDQQPTAVWTGSTNITEGGIFGHSNVGHLVRDGGIAARYLAYWEQLAKNPEAKTLRQWDGQNSLVPTDLNASPLLTPVYSPRDSLQALDSYAERMNAAHNSVFFTAAFGISKQLEKVLMNPKPYLRYVLLEKPSSSVTVMKRDPNNQFAVGSLVPDNKLEGWVKETLTGLNTNVRYVHTKYMLVDPLSDDPTALTGSANFSEPSTTNNDENMLVIRGNTTIADIYLGEFMRLFNHYDFRQHLTKPLPLTAERGIGSPPERPAAWKPKKNLDETGTWVKKFFDADSMWDKERRLFS